MHDSIRRRLGAAVLTLFLPTAICCGGSLPAQSDGAQSDGAQADTPTPQPKFGTIFKREIDGLIAAISASRREDGSFLDGTALTTAKALTAMGHSHRFYTLGDGPVVRQPVLFLFQNRAADGSFVDGEAESAAAVETTGWVRAALAVTDPVEHAAEVTSIGKWLHDHDSRGAGPWEALLIELGATMRHENIDPKRAGEAVATAVARGPILAPDGSIDAAKTVDSLLHLVGCQSIARRLDRGHDANAAFGEVAQRGFDFLLTQQEDGVFYVRTPDGEFPDDGLTGLGLAALQTKPRTLRTASEQATIQAGLGALFDAQNEDGSFGRNTVNYATCSAVLALSMADDPRHDDALRKAREYILALQNTEDRGYAQADRDYGSIGYGGDQRGDLSNVGFAVDALRKSGVDEQHEALQKAIVFLQRTQNFRKVNDHEGRRVKDEDGEWIVVRPGDDGGSAYYPGNSPAGYDELDDGSRVPRSYGSMTYMLLKTYILCGLPADDERIQKAVQWVSMNWNLDENPGSSPLLGEKAKYQGLYYYYMVLAQALDTAGLDTLRDPQGMWSSEHATKQGDKFEIDWRAELRAKLAELQRADGSWLNEQNGRWWESQTTVCTIYAMLALQRCQQ